MDDTAKATAITTHAGRWKKGQSGNPQGRPKSSLESRLACRALNERTLAVLVQLLDDESPDMRFKAACRIRDEANGKPVQQVLVEQQDRDELASKSDEELLAIVQGIALEQASRGTGAQS